MPGRFPGCDERRDGFPMSDGSSLYERVGGADGVTRIVDELYRRVLADPELSPFFARTPPERLKEMQRQFIAVALGGPFTYGGRPLAEAHRGRGITRHHLHRFTAHLVAALRGQLDSADDAQAIAARLNLFADEVTGDHSAENP
jgi:hemoglobin